MIAHIRHSFYELLEEVTWMNDETRRVAKDKVGLSNLVNFSERKSVYGWTIKSNVGMLMKRR